MVTASPRVDYALLAAPDGQGERWQEFRPRPATLQLGTMLRRLLWNAQWNESLFLVSLAERMMRAPTIEAAAQSERELLLRVARHLHRQGACDDLNYLQIRLRLVSRPGETEQVTDEIVYLSNPCLIAGLITP